MARIEEIAQALREAELDGWLFYDFRMSDPLAYRILGLPEHGLTTRRWFYFIPASGTPQALVSAVEAHRLDALPTATRVPYASRVDAGTVELVRATGVEVVTAADLVQRFEATLSPAQLDGHRRAATALREIAHETFAEIARRVRANLPCTEFSIQRFVLERIAARGMRTDEAPIVAVNANAANPHFSVTEKTDTPIRRGDLVLLDLFAKETAPDSIYGDLTWMGFVGERVPDEYARTFAIVARARDAAVELIQSRVGERQPVSGEDADRAAREIIEQAGFGDAFVHRTGHSIGREVHGTGANLDSLETRDHRMLIEQTCFSVEPGIYLNGRFGIRSELDMTIEDGHADVSAAPAQDEIIPLLSRFS